MKLDNQQEAAVKTESNRVLVLAGAGSGKTRTLTERIAYLIEEKKVSPYEILSFTFTRKAAGEMKSRLEDRIGTESHHVNMGTMHSIALQFIHRFGETIGLRSKGVTVYSQWESNYLLKEIAIEMGIFKKSWNPKKKVVDEVFADYYERGILPAPDHPAHDIFNVFISRCKENNALTYGALLIGMELLIPVLAKHLHYRHILVDEVQDIDPLQWRIIEALCKAFNAQLFVVGDIDQSIYEFRGAVPGYLIDNQETFDVFRIENNYRSDATIVKAANSLIQHNTDRIEKTMVATKRKTHEAIDLIKNMDSAKIVYFLASSAIKSDSTIAVLCRVHGPLVKLSELLTDAGIDHTYVGKKSALTNSEEFRRFHAFLKLIVNPYDNFAFLLVKDLIGLSKEGYLDIRSQAASEGKSHFQAWKSQSPAWGEVWNIFQETNLDNVSVELDIIFRNGLMNQDEGTQAYGFVQEWVRDNPTGTVQQYLDWLATYDLQEEIKENEGLQLMTVHAAKGLEWSTVIIAGVNEGLLPSKQAIKADDVESERRLAYVAFTRARDQLILTVRPETSENERTNKITLTPISRFVKESKIGG